MDKDNWGEPGLGNRGRARRIPAPSWPVREWSSHPPTTYPAPVCGDPRDAPAPPATSVPETRCGRSGTAPGPSGPRSPVRPESGSAAEVTTPLGEVQVRKGRGVPLRLHKGPQAPTRPPFLPESTPRVEAPAGTGEGRPHPDGCPERGAGMSPWSPSTPEERRSQEQRVYPTPSSEPY